ncbi:MAG: outer membrane protein assembly factor BamC [Bdellovibrionales bacterium]|nr:outer membrane protein assembly factor BamC [Bdellovibrionales bacterium]
MRLFVIGTSLLLLFACVSKDFAEPRERGRTSKAVKKNFGYSYTDVWNSAVAVLESKSYLITQNRKDRGIIATDWISGKSDRLFSGYGDSRIPYTVRYRFTLDIQPTKSGTRVVITNKEQYLTDAVTGGFDFQGSLYHWLDTASSGNKEAQILQDLTQTLATSKN